MTTFSDAFKRDVTIPAALFAMLYSEKTQIALKNILSDIEMLSTVDDYFKPQVGSKDSAVFFLIDMSSRLSEAHPDLLPDAAVLMMIEEHQKRTFNTSQDAQNRIDAVRKGAFIEWNTPPELVAHPT